MSDRDYNILIDTPENLELEAETAGFGSRCLASLLDHIFLLILLIIMTIMFAQVAKNNQSGRADLLFGIYILLVFLLLVFYHLFFEFLWNGQTPGKRLIGIRVVHANGMPATTTGLLIRNMVRLFDFLPIFYGIGLVIMFASRRTQRLGDIAGHTMVIYEHGQLTLKSIRESSSFEYGFVKKDEAVPDYIDIRQLSAQDRQTLVNYLQRRHQIQNRNALVYMLANKFAAKMEVTREHIPAGQFGAERFLEFIALAFDRDEHPV